VFAGLFVLLAGVGWLSARMARRASDPAGATGAAGATGTATGAAAAGGAQAALVRALPFATVAIAAFVPLAAGLYLATSAAWTLAERAVLWPKGPAAGH
jgi:YidC/Oxa1 family membrane protein insertase